MKKKIIISSIVVLIILAMIGILFYQSEKSLRQKLDLYFEQLDAMEVTKNDDIGVKVQTLLTNYNIISGKMNEIVFEQNIYKDLEGAKEQANMQKLLWEEMQKEMQQFSKDEVGKLFEDSYSSHLNYVRTTYEKSDFYQKVNEMNQKIVDGQRKMDKIIEYAEYLINHSTDWNYFDSVLYYENEEVGTTLQNYMDALSFSTKVEKGVLSYTTASIPILMYHGVSDNVWGISSLFVSPKDFEEQMKYISENGFTPIFMHEIEHLDSSIQKPIVITFDDGNYDLYTEAFPILKKYNIKATIYIISGFGDGIYTMTLDQAKELSDSGLISLQSHTVTHKPLATLSLDQIEIELRDSKKTLEDLTGKEVYSIAYPTGSYDKRVIEIAKKYYKYGLLAGGGTAEINQDMSYFEINRIGIYRGESLSSFIKSCETAKR